ncbi:protein kilB [Streptomyces jumonjinensis]|uniref:Protein kilB n=1 Tax=Streptomyces jumonjinensis TaxID=1945 RepID=A0A646KL28_STRJU|nr:protein kilB [Streptomyces jumonjinensis]
MLSTVIAVVGTLLGAAVAGILQHRTARTTRSEARDDHRRDRELEAITAVASHLRAMALREDLRLSDAGPEAITAARAESHATRSAIEAPKVQVAILVPSLAAAAEDAIHAALALRVAADHQTLNALRKDAITATDRFVTAAARHFA